MESELTAALEREDELRKACSALANASQLNPNRLTGDLADDRQELGRTLIEWRDAGGPVEAVVYAIDELICVRLRLETETEYVSDAEIAALRKDVLSHDFMQGEPRTNKAPE